MNPQKKKGKEAPKKASDKVEERIPHPHGELEGEGSYTATRRYNKNLRKSIERGDIEELAEEARRALEGEEGPGLRKAERTAKRGKTPAPRGRE